MLGDRDYMRNDWDGGTYTPRWQEQSVVKKLIIANIAIFILQFLFGLTSYLWLSVPTMKALELWRFVTYMFAHATISHIFFNMWALYLFGKPIEQRIGSAAFLKLYFISGFIGALAWLSFNLNSRVPVIGASGAVFGVMTAAAMLFPDMRMMLLFPPMVLKVKTAIRKLRSEGFQYGYALVIRSKMRLAFLKSSSASAYLWNS